MRPGECEQVVPDLAGGAMKLDRKAFLTAFRMLGQGSVCKTKPVDITFFVNDINNARRVQRPKAEMPDDNCDRRANIDQRA